MKRPPLGKIGALLIASVLPLLAAVKATVDRPLVYRGEPVTLTIQAEGENIAFPQLYEIAGYPIEGQSSQRHVSIINGQTQRTVERQLQFTPAQDVTIPSLDISVDGKMEHTLPVAVKVTTPRAGSADAPLQFEMQLDKREVYVGEPIQLTLILRIRPDQRIENPRFKPLELSDFWVKQIDDDAVRGQENGYITRTIRYLLFPQKSGELTIPATYAEVSRRIRSRRTNPIFSDPFFYDSLLNTRVQRQKIFATDLNLSVKPLPQGVELFGDFTLHAEVDKQKVKANKPVHLTIRIEGEGNVEDIRKFSPTLPNALVYADDPKRTSQMRNGRYYGTFEQKIAVIPDRNVTILPMSLRYFDKNTHEIVTKRTPPFVIEVENPRYAVAATSPGATPHVESAPATTPQSPVPLKHLAELEALALFAVGFVSGLITFWLLGLWGRERPERDLKIEPMARRIRRAKSDAALFELLLPYRHDDPLIAEAVATLEAKLYGKGEGIVDRKALIAFFSQGPQKRGVDRQLL